MTDNPIVAFLRRILVEGNDVAPTIVLGVPDPSTEQKERIMQFAEHLADLGYIESSMPGFSAWGPGGDILRVRVTDAGLAYLDEHR